MTTVYFVRHAQPDFTVRDDQTRPLTDQGKADVQIVTAFLQNKEIDVVFSSPYQRTVDTVTDFANRNHLPVIIVEDFRERCVGCWVEDFTAFAKQQWADFSFKLPGGESLAQVQRRNIQALHILLDEYPDKNVVIGTHGTALSTILNYFDSSYGYNDFEKIARIMPWVVKMEFEGDKYAGIEKIDI